MVKTSLGGSPGGYHRPRNHDVPETAIPIKPSPPTPGNSRLWFDPSLGRMRCFDGKNKPLPDTRATEH